MIASRENHVMEISKKSPKVFEKFPDPRGLESAAVVLKIHRHTYFKILNLYIYVFEIVVKNFERNSSKIDSV